MKNISKITIYFASGFFIAFLLSGCGQSQKEKKKPTEVRSIPAGTTIGSLAEVISPDVVPVQGFALIGELKGTGSAECPAEIRAQLTKYILKQLPGVNVEKLLNSKNTAVVLVEGLMPLTATSNQYFDLKVTALAESQTISLEGGQLYGTELRAAGSMGLATKVLAHAEGPVFMDKIGSTKPDKRTGYILAGARVIDKYKLALVIREPGYLISNAIRNKLIERFGDGVAKAVSPGRVELTVPPKYEDQKQRFISIVKMISLGEDQQSLSKRIDELARKLKTSAEKDSAETALEAIGNQSLERLTTLLNSPDEEVKLRAARCMLNLGSDAGLDTLRNIAFDKRSEYRIETLKALTVAARRNDAASIARRLLRDEDLSIRLAAYEHLRKLDDITMTQTLVGRNFYLEQLAATKYNSIFVSRSGQPRIALLGGPIYCRKNIFIQSDDGNITINALPGENYVSIIRKLPERPTIAPIMLKCSYELSDIILTLGEEPIKKSEEGHIGLGVSYTEIIALLKQMVDKEAVNAEFRAGPSVQIGLK